jgi:hypothetical protein
MAMMSVVESIWFTPSAVEDRLLLACSERVG